MMRELLQTKMEVPEYQRAYSWNEQHIDDFFSDLTRFIKRNEECYVFGVIIVHKDKDKDKFYIVDGQQRITTSIIFACALRDIIKEEELTSCERLKNKLDNVIGFEDDGFNLTVNPDNQEFFYNYIQRNDKSWKEKQVSDSNIRTAYLYLRDKIKEYVNATSNPVVESIEKLTYSFLDRFHVSYVETDVQSQAFTIFETLNSRGTPLEVSDLLKNHFFGMIDEDHNYVKVNWASMAHDIAKCKKGNMTQYIRYFWNSSHDFIREKEMFKEISGLEKVDVYSFLRELSDNVKTYTLLISPEKIVEEFDAKCKRSLCNLREFGATSYYPLVFSMMLKKCKKDQISTILAAIECMVFRNQIIGKKVANSNEKLFSSWACKLSKGTTIEQIQYEIYRACDSDEKVHIGFKDFSPCPRVGKSLLININDFEHPEMNITKESNKVHLEHVLPKKAEKWNVSQEFVDKYVGRFGNMTLLFGKKNIKASNDPFEKKRTIYSSSDIADTKEISKLDKWTQEEIELRQEDLYQRSIKRWPILATDGTHSSTLDRFESDFSLYTAD